MVIPMTKKNMKEQFEDAKMNVPVHMIYGLKALSEVLLDDFHNNHGLFLDKEARSARGNQPLATADGTIEITTHGHTFKIEANDPDLPMVSLPVGMSDKVTTAAIPWQKICGLLFQELITVFEGTTNADYAMTTVMPRVNAYIDSGLEETDGKIKINQSKLSEVVNAVEVAQFLNSLKRNFTSKSRGTPVLNLSLVCPTEPTEEEMKATHPVPVIDSNQVLQTPLSDGIGSHQTSAEVTTKHEDASPSVMSVSPPVASGGTEVANGSHATSTLLTERAQISTIIREALGDEKRTIGYLKKVIDMDEDAWRARLDSMLKTGEVCKEGERRSCRYFLPGVVQ